MYNDSDLFQGCLKNDRIAQRQLYEKYAGRMLVVAHRYTKATQEAEDVLQEAFIKVFKNISSYKKECPLEFWIRKIVINTALNQNRSKIYLYPAVDIEKMDFEQDENFSLSEFNLNELLAIIRQLAPRYQVIFNLYAIEGYTHAEIAEMLGISEGTSKSQYSRARAILQELVKEKHNHEKSRQRV
jgi:RNA polymerase sigma factor (sigma-70 family)